MDAVVPWYEVEAKAGTDVAQSPLEYSTMRKNVSDAWGWFGDSEDHDRRWHEGNHDAA
jgi:hypothetical protein